MRVEEKYNDALRIDDIMTKDMNFVHVTTSIAEAAKIMQLHNCSTLPVGSEFRVKGFITDRDITIRGVAQGKNPYETMVGDIISSEVYSCMIYDDIERAIDEMYTNNVKQLVVKNTGDKIVGMVSLKNILGNVMCKNIQNGCIQHKLKEIA